MAAGEDQPQTIIFNSLRVRRFRGAGICIQPRRQLGHRFVQTSATPHRIDRLVPPGGNEPAARIARHAIPRPLLHRGGEGIVQGLFRQIEIAKQADQCRKDTSRFGPIDGPKKLARLWVEILASHFNRDHIAPMADI